MSEFSTVSTLAVLNMLDPDEIYRGYVAGLNGESEPGSDKSRSFHHGWRNGMVDSGRMEKDSAQAALAEEAHRAQYAH